MCFRPPSVQKGARICPGCHKIIADQTLKVCLFCDAELPEVVAGMSPSAETPQFPRPDPGMPPPQLPIPPKAPPPRPPTPPRSQEGESENILPP